MTVRKIGTWKDALRRRLEAAESIVFAGSGEIAPVLSQVDGYLYGHEAAFFYRLARESPGSGAVVEIGSFRGRSTLCFALGLRRRGAGRVFAVDPHVYRTEAELRENLAHFGAEEWVSVEVAPSREYAAGWCGPIRILLIDGDHSEEAARGDLEAWLPHLEPGGFVLLHDSTDLAAHPGPRKVAEESFRAGPWFDQIGTLGLTTWGRRAGSGLDYRPRVFGSGVMDRALHLKRRLRKRSRNIS
ncbi:MAG TPA: class I SAM-dependent methyltransferase [Candidatus Polarisedimenticolia bacterium]|nr:class I SAM-dependent methyltransferase [Candidatus Polarisedimenticolia bacterium]